MTTSQRAAAFATAMTFALGVTSFALSEGVRAEGSTHPECPTAAPAASVWRVPAGMPHGVHEFTSVASLEVPSDVHSMTVELWGGGGGGGGGSTETYTLGGAGGGGGTSGAYLRAVLSVDPATTYGIGVGAGGRGGAVAKAGENGADSVICRGTIVLLSAAGGAAGQGARANDHPGTGGHASSSDATDNPSSSAIRRAGSEGAAGALPLFEYRGWGGRGGSPIPGSVQPPGSFGGAGGVGEMRPETPGHGQGGGAGSVVVIW